MGPLIARENQPLQAKPLRELLQRDPFVDREWNLNFYNTFPFAESHMLLSGRSLQQGQDRLARLRGISREAVMDRSSHAFALDKEPGVLGKDRFGKIEEYLARFAIFQPFSPDLL